MSTNSTSRHQIHRNMQQLLKDLGHTQRAICDWLEWDDSTFERFLHGKNRFTPLERVEAFAEALGLSFEVIYHYHEHHHDKKQMLAASAKPFGSWQEELLATQQKENQALKQALVKAQDRVDHLLACNQELVARIQYLQN